jgi:hypothetical protein
MMRRHHRDEIMLADTVHRRVTHAVVHHGHGVVHQRRDRLGRAGGKRRRRILSHRRCRRRSGAVLLVLRHRRQYWRRQRATMQTRTATLKAAMAQPRYSGLAPTYTVTL